MTQDSAPQPYGTPEVPRVAVRGEARLEVDPEIARLGITVTARGTDRRTALEDLTRRNNTVLELVKSYGDAVEKLETGAFSINPELTRHGRAERIRAYHGRVHITTELADFTALGELTTRLADLELTSVDGPWWALRPTSPAHGEARRQAVLEAVQRAREYAAALGADLAALVELADLGAENALPFQAAAPGAGMRTMAFSTTEETAPPLDLEPQRQTVYAQVNARFTMTPPQL
ncbi:MULTISPECIES: SIMPL domain-containing protein [unclassified Streptomyces]|uniref:SIMPL domain-containing protein n=1 Tax=unclassified Streptomyces TaxID=2593676 RepID=UPI002250226A|nr:MULTISPECIES: SIMPL domain-containing protein [unclassified Streptomyces]MCX4630453.1 SIMPL domain-containing protein [Streptomyces sp. NBC_01443]WSW46385.1 SIMPL domain-containing protein [Streptomyces sp. NBC_01001]